MQLVDQAVLPPGMCAITKQGPGGPFLDLGREYDFDHEGRVYVHVSAIRDMWEHVRHLYERPVTDLRDERIRDLEGQVEQLELELQSVYVLKNTRFQQQRKPGRPPKGQVVADGS